MTNRKHAPAPRTRSVTIHGTHNIDDIRTELVFTWNPIDPLAVKLTATAGGQEPVEWWIARDLLIDYHQQGWAGIGDLRLYTADDPGTLGNATIHFSSPEGDAWVEVPESRLRAYAALMRDTAERNASHEAAIVGAAIDVVLHALCGDA